MLRMCRRSVEELENFRTFPSSTSHLSHVYMFWFSLSQVGDLYTHQTGCCLFFMLCVWELCAGIVRKRRCCDRAFATLGRWQFTTGNVWFLEFIDSVAAFMTRMKGC